MNVCYFGNRHGRLPTNECMPTQKERMQSTAIKPRMFVAEREMNPKHKRSKRFIASGSFVEAAQAELMPGEPALIRPSSTAAKGPARTKKQQAPTVARKCHAI